MQSGECNKNSEKTTICLTSEKASLHVQHTIFVQTTTRNFQKLPGYLFYGGNVIHVLVHFFFTVAHFHPGGRLHFLFSHCCYKISCCSSNKKCLLCFFYLTLALFLIQLCWPVALLSLFLCLSLSLFSKFGDMTINLHLTL